ncbi:MAG: RNA 2',3'-cyclic phosphodiesterase [Candidatus Promineifilaceae bacterium]|jgi:2'-5' RNA ligase
MKETIRTFIAIHLPQEVKDYLGELTDNLAGQVPRHSVRWVKPDRMHLTLRFIGETEKNLLPMVAKALDEVAAGQRPFNLNLEGFGCFPNCKRPRVLWAGLGGDVDSAGQLKNDIDAALIPLGWDKEDRPFQPHLTAGRVKDSQAIAGQRWPDKLKVLPIPVNSIYLIESELTPNGPIYTVRHSSSLAA